MARLFVLHRSGGQAISPWPGRPSTQKAGQYMANPITRAWQRLIYGPANQRFENRTTKPQDTNPPVNMFMRRAGALVTHETALQVAAVFACVRYIAESIGTLPWMVFEAQQGRRVEARQSNLWSMLHNRPNPEMSSMAFKETLIGHALLWGNAYAEIERDVLRRPLALWPLTPDRVSPKRDEAGQLVYEINNHAGPKTTLPAADVYHLHGLGYDGLVGYSVVTMASRSMGTSLAQDEFSNSFYGNNTVVGFHLEHPSALSDKAYDRLVTSWENRHKGARNAYRPAILEEGMKAQNVGMPLKDAEYLSSRHFGVEEICRWFRVPPHKVSHLLRSTFNNIEHQSIEAVTDALLPWCVRMEQEANHKLVGTRNQNKTYTKLNLGGLLRGDMKTRAEYYQLMRNMGAFSINMILGLEDMDPIGPEGDVHVMQQQYVPLDMLGQQLNQTPEAPPNEGDQE